MALVFLIFVTTVLSRGGGHGFGGRIHFHGIFGHGSHYSYHGSHSSGNYLSINNFMILLVPLLVKIIVS
uniref:Secreted protein n=1 Tax=Acrobeloides nanus TaxID=290746 RepID=A0A914E8A6_9BILA